MFNSGLQERVKIFDQPVHDLNPYVLCSNVLFLSHYAEGGSKPDQTAHFNLIIFL